MIKQVPVSNLRPGMHLHKLGGSWMEHPFWRRSFRLKPSDLQQILKTGIEVAWIDTDRGLDLEAQAPAATGADATGPETQPLPQWFHQEEVVESIVMPRLSDPTAPMPLDEPEADGLDIKRASQICTDAGEVLRRLHSDVRMGRAIDARRCSRVVDDIVECVTDNPAALLLMVRLKRHDPYTYMHSIAVSALLVALGKQLGFSRPQMCEVGVAGMLHDIGKLFLPAELLQRPGPLTTNEYVLVKNHVQRGYAALLQMPAPSPVALDICLHHHERLDGSGYPHGLQREAISVHAKMAAICDVYDAITSERPYRPKLDPGRALRQMAAAQGLFDPLIFQAFVRTVGLYPVGIVVRLKSNRLGVVVAQDESSLLKPTVKVFYSIEERHTVPPSVLQLANDQCEDRIVDVDSSPEMQTMALAEL